MLNFKLDSEPVCQPKLRETGSLISMWRHEAVSGLFPGPWLTTNKWRTQPVPVALACGHAQPAAERGSAGPGLGPSFCGCLWVPDAWVGLEVRFRAWLSLGCRFAGESSAGPGQATEGQGSAAYPS